MDLSEIAVGVLAVLFGIALGNAMYSAVVC